MLEKGLAGLTYKVMFCQLIICRHGNLMVFLNTYSDDGLYYEQ